MKLQINVNIDITKSHNFPIVDEHTPGIIMERRNAKVVSNFDNLYDITHHLITNYKPKTN